MAAAATRRRSFSSSGASPAIVIKPRCPVVGSLTCHCGPSPPSHRQVSLSSVFRKLWGDHAWLTSDYINASIFQLPTATVLRARLLANQPEIGNEFGSLPTVGVAAGNEIGKALTDHIAKAEQVVLAAISGDQIKTEAKIEEFYAQGDELSAVFAKALNGDKKAIAKEFRTHNERVVNLAVILLDPKRADTWYIAELDAYISHMMHVSDVLLAIALAKK